MQYRKSFELWYRSQSQDSKTSELNCLYEVFFQKEALTICHDEIFASFLSVLSLSSVFSCKGWWYSCIILTVVCKIQKDIKPVFSPRIKFLSEKPIVLWYNTTGSLANKIRTYSWSKKNICWLIIGKILWHIGKNPREARHW